MGNREDIALMAHLMRRAGFGATWDEIEELVEQGYEETVEQLLQPEDQPAVDLYTLYRYHPITEGCREGPLRLGRPIGSTTWLTPSVLFKRRWCSFGTISLPPAIPR